MALHAQPKRPAGPGRPVTGRMVLAMMLAGFGIIIAANLALLFAATGTFPGLVVGNAYVASQEWNRKTAAQRALGWHAAAAYADGTLGIRISGRDGAPVGGLAVRATVGRPAGTREDVTLDLAAGNGGYAAPLELGPGRWRIALAATGADGESFEATAEITVPGNR